MCSGILKDKRGPGLGEGTLKGRGAECRVQNRHLKYLRVVE